MTSVVGRDKIPSCAPLVYPQTLIASPNPVVDNALLDWRFTRSVIHLTHVSSIYVLSRRAESWLYEEVV